MSGNLTEKQRKFVEAYMGNGGNGVKAAEAAGYSGGYETLASTASENLQKPKIQRAIDEIAKQDPLIADREERQRFWTKIIRDESAGYSNRLGASKLLGKSQGDFVDRHEISGPDGDAIEHSLALSDKSDEELEEFLSNQQQIYDEIQDD